MAFELTLPSLTAYDPPEAGEGTLDPMGLGVLSERLANDLVPDFRARMSQFRFLTAMAVSTLACGDLSGITSSDDRTSWPVAFEWVLIEAFARHGIADPGVPGARKARNCVLRSERLSAKNYLKGPTVFGFHGVYKPLASRLGIVEAGDYGPGDFDLGPTCTALVEAWEKDCGLTGFSDNRRGTEGQRIRQQLRSAVGESLRAGRCAVKPRSTLFATLATALRPAILGKSEASELRRLLELHVAPQTVALAALLDANEYTSKSESEIVASLRQSASIELQDSLGAIETYETFATTLDAVFNYLRFLCTATDTDGIHAVAIETLSNIDENVLTTARGLLPDQFDTAKQALPSAHSIEFEAAFAPFGEVASVADLAAKCLSHHANVQARKGCQPWIEHDDDRFVVRLPYVLQKEPQLGAGYIHPIRLRPLTNFLAQTK
ncbi:hypothetical protein [Gordonia amicalis]|uniref:hypothetical protein n=1 Tax=Gordonia amicalis TaxID=89053 RepID=UPI0015F37A2B|nr:hypothetical protein [Gordonia amicalis]MBA5846866.1 hypothetical protein [Gordonia amicalis]